jgi:thioredoxin reductase (NADPH)
VVIEDGAGRRATEPACGVFVMIGALPRTDWLEGAFELDDRRFLVTGSIVPGAPTTESPFATNVPGVFAVGDVRSGSVKRVAAAVGEGAQVVSAIHRFLAASGEPSALPQPAKAGIDPRNGSIGHSGD